MTAWQRWIGKPHQFAADPDVTDGCDCLVMFGKVRRLLGLPCPDDATIQRLLTLGAAAEFEEIHALIAPHLIAQAVPSEGSFTINTVGGHIGVAVVVDEGLLHVSLKHGVRWVSLENLRQLNWYDWK
jgi:hypothetical protein